MIDLNNYDWEEVLSYAGPGFVSVALGSSASDAPLPTKEGSSLGQGQSPVDSSTVDVVAFAEGENDGPDWLLVFRTPDGRWWFTSAGCDYTGWDCQAGGHTIVSHSQAHLVQFGLDDSARSRLTWKDGYEP